MVYDSIPGDSLVEKKSKKTETIESEVNYDAADSMIYSLGEEKVYLYGDALISYQDIEISAARIEFDMSTNILNAYGREDSLGILQGKPKFNQANESFEARTLSYNFDTKKGFIEAIITEQEGGYLHSQKTKKQADGQIHMRQGKYTTCDLEHPHYYIALTRAKSIPGDKIVSGPAYFVIEDVPIPIGIPFGFFPNSSTRSSGLLIPTYGLDGRRGYYLQNGGFYFALNDYFDLRVTGDVYTNGTWGTRIGSNYRKRYKYSGSLNTRYFRTITGEKGLPNYRKGTDYSILWSHSQDPKANPYSNFRASVNFSSSSYDVNHSRNIQNALTNTKQSSISYSRSWPARPFNFSASLNHSQNSRNKSVNMVLPKMTFSMNRIYPFRKLTQKSSSLLNDFQINYSANFDNRLNTVDSLLFTDTKIEDFNTGFQHNLPLSLNIKALNFFNITPSIRYTGVMFTKRTMPRFEQGYVYENMDRTADTLIIDTIPGVYYAHAYVPSVGVSFQPKVYGFFTFRKKSRIEAIRHVMSPSVSFSYTPDMTGKVPDYYIDVNLGVDTVTKQRFLYSELGDTINATQAMMNQVKGSYSIYDESVYRIPVPAGRQGSVSFSLRNNVEMKIKSKSDTAQEMKKIKLLDNLNFSTNYNIFAEQFKWSPISMVGNTSLFKRQLNLKFNGRFDPYGIVRDSITQRWTRVNEPVWKTSDQKQLLRLTSFGFSVSFRLRSSQGKGQGQEEQPRADISEPSGLSPDEVNYSGYDDTFYGQYVDFDIPWSLSFDYNFNYSRPFEESNIVQTLRVSGDISLTPKWKIGVSTGYDFKAKKMSTTNLNIYRDLHCWEMRLSSVPFGTFRSYGFQINIKSSILRDIKYEKNDSWIDN